MHHAFAYTSMVIQSAVVVRAEMASGEDARSKDANAREEWGAGDVRWFSCCMLQQIGPVASCLSLDVISWMWVCQ